MSPDIPGWFFVIFFLVAVRAVGSGIWRVTTARRMARDAGLSPRAAAAVTLLGRDGLGAAYLASALTPQAQQQPNDPVQRPRTAEQRLEELAAPKAKNLITENEYDARRQEILGTIQRALRSRSRNSQEVVQ